MSHKSRFLTFIILVYAICAGVVGAFTAVGSSAAAAPVTWNTSDASLPLLNLPDRVQSDLGATLAYPFGKAGLPLFQSLYFNASRREYLLMLISSGTREVNFVRLTRTGANTYAVGNTTVQLRDYGNVKTIRAGEGALYRFSLTADGEFRCTHIDDPSGVRLEINYTSQGGIDTVQDSSGRIVEFRYDRDAISSISQIWVTNLVTLTKTWAVGSFMRNITVRDENGVGFGRAKAVPRNAVTPVYDKHMAEVDRQLASIFGGPDAVAAANGFEPAGLANQYPVYRGDLRGDDGIIRTGHLSYAIHLYGSIDGTGNTPLYVPSGFTSHSNEPSPTDAAVTFFYPRLGNLTNVTLAVFHVDDFQLSPEGNRVRIGEIGGRGGSYAFYKHSHIEFYRGNTGLPSLSDRQTLRIPPTAVF